MRLYVCAKYFSLYMSHYRTYVVMHALNEPASIGASLPTQTTPLKLQRESGAINQGAITSSHHQSSPSSEKSARFSISRSKSA